MTEDKIKKIEDYTKQIKEYFNNIDVDYRDNIIESALSMTNYNAKKELRNLLGGDKIFVGQSLKNIDLYETTLFSKDNLFIKDKKLKINLLNRIINCSEDGRTVCKEIEDYNILEIEKLLEQTNSKFKGRVKQLFTPGLKLSKLFAKLIQEDSLNIEYSKILQEAKPLSIYLGIRPIDFLTMSDGNSWSSCHSISAGGCYQTGGMSLSNDQYSIIAWAGEELGKEWRQVFYVDPKQKLIVASRAYPATNSGATELIKRYLKKLIFDGTEEEVIIAKGSNVEKYLETHEDELFYNDIKEGFTENVFALYKKGKKPNPIVIGKEVRCPTCGGYLDDPENIYCCHKEYEAYCSRCGEGLDEDDIYWVDDEDFCSYCFHRDFFHCASCGDATRLDEGTITSDNEQICNYCLDKDYSMSSELCGVAENSKLVSFRDPKTGEAKNILIKTILDDPLFEEIQDLFFLLRRNTYYPKERKVLLEAGGYYNLNQYGVFDMTNKVSEETLKKIMQEY